jgi:hypothetical protein
VLKRWTWEFEALSFLDCAAFWNDDVCFFVLIGMGSAMADSSKEELVQLIKRFGAYLTVKISNLLPISLQNLVRTSIPFSANINFETFLKFMVDLVLISRQESIALVKIYVVIWWCLLVYSLVSIFSLIYAEFGACLNVNSGLDYWKRLIFKQTAVKIIAISDDEI